MARPTAQTFKVLSVKHPCFSPEDNDLNLALYEGSKRFNALRAGLLDPRQQDANSLYRHSREQVARYENHVAGMLDYSRSIGMQARPRLVFEGPPEKLRYYNTLNDGLADTIEGRWLDMQIYGYGLFTASYPATTVPTQPRNLAQQLVPGGALDAKICWLCPGTITDWETGPLGELLLIKVYTEQTVKDAGGYYDQVVYTWTYITETEKVIYSITKKKDEKLKDTDLIPRMLEPTPIKNGLPVFEASLINRACIMTRVQDQALGTYNAESNWKFAVGAQCFAQAWYAGSLPPEEFSPKVGEGVIKFLGLGGQFGYAVPSNVAFDAISKLAESENANLRAHINSEFMKLADKDQHAASGDAKAEDKEAGKVSAETYAVQLAAALCRCVDYIRISRKDYDPKTGLETVKFHLEGMNCFNPDSIGDSIDNLTKFTILPGVSPTAVRVATRGVAHAMTPNATAEERQQIDDETNTAEIEAPAPSALSSSATAFSQSGAAASSGPGSTAAPSSTAAKSSTGKAAAPDTGPNITIPTKLKQIDPRRVQPQHDTDKAFVATMKKKIGAEGYNPKYPALLVEVPTLHDDGGSVYKSLDAHHRIEASKELSQKTVPAYVIAFNDWLRLTNAFPFDPKQLSGLDSHIELPDGRTYDQVREKNSHTNGSMITGAASSAASSARSAA